MMEISMMFIAKMFIIRQRQDMNAFVKKQTFAHDGAPQHFIMGGGGPHEVQSVLRSY